MLLVIWKLLHEGETYNVGCQLTPETIRRPLRANIVETLLVP
jgi:hypothetical protein